MAPPTATTPAVVPPLHSVFPLEDSPIKTEVAESASLVRDAADTSDDEDDRQRCQHPGSGASGGAAGSHSGNSGNANSSHSEKGLARLRSNKNH